MESHAHTERGKTSDKQQRTTNHIALPSRQVSSLTSNNVFNIDAPTNGAIRLNTLHPPPSNHIPQLLLSFSLYCLRICCDIYLGTLHTPPPCNLCWIGTLSLPCTYPYESPVQDSIPSPPWDDPPACAPQPSCSLCASAFSHRGCAIP